MARTKTTPARRRAPEPEPSLLGPGLHGAFLELLSGDTYRVRTAAGLRISAVLGDGVDPGLAEECLRAGTMVVLADTALGPAIVGALQTSRPVVRDANDALTFSARDIKLHADRGITLQVGAVSMHLDRSGAVRFEGERMVIDMAAIVRVLSAQMEIP